MPSPSRNLPSLPPLRHNPIGRRSQLFQVDAPAAAAQLDGFAATVDRAFQVALLHLAHHSYRQLGAHAPPRGPRIHAERRRSGHAHADAAAAGRELHGAGQFRWQHGADGAAAGRGFNRAVHLLDPYTAAASSDLRRPLKLSNVYRPASRGAVERAGAAVDFDAAAARAEAEAAFAIGCVDAPASSIAVERTVQARETQSPSASLCLHVARKVNHVDATSARPGPGVELRWQADGVFGFVLIPPAQGPGPLGFAVGPNRHRIALLGELDGIVAQECLLVGLLPPADLAPDIHNDFAGGVGADIDGAEVHLDHDGATRLDGEALVELFFRRSQGDGGARQQKEYDWFQRN